MDDLATLEQQLLRDPFDASLRRVYASRLAGAGRHADALEQWNLVIRQEEPSADALLEAAICCIGLGDLDQARRLFDTARASADFDAADARARALEARMAAATTDAGGGARDEAVECDDADGGAAAPRRLHAIEGGRQEEPRAEVISIRSTGTVRFADVIGMDELKKVLRLRIIEPFLRPGLFERFKRRSGGGVLLYGPPGCGKTLIARAVATECEARFTHIGISDVLNLWVGESERNLAGLFEEARQHAPSVVFFDELDALAYSRSKSRQDHTRTIVNEFLNQLDGMSGRNEKVLVLAATNMPWDVDDAMKRPGRFDRQIFVPPPDAAARAEMLRAKLIDVPTEAIDFDRVAAGCQHFSGADMDGVIERAKDAVILQVLDGGEERPLRSEDLIAAAESSEPSTLDWLKSVRNVVKFGGAGHGYKDVEQYLRRSGLY